MKCLHTHLTTPIRHVDGALEALPRFLSEGEVVIALYTQEQGDIVISDYRVTAGHYEGDNAIADNHAAIDIPEGYWMGG
jgi:hypothetical protein